MPGRTEELGFEITKQHDASVSETTDAERRTFRGLGRCTDDMASRYIDLVDQLVDSVIE